MFLYVYEVIIFRCNIWRNLHAEHSLLIYVMEYLANDILDWCGLGWNLPSQLTLLKLCQVGQFTGQHLFPGEVNYSYKLLLQSI